LLHAARESPVLRIDADSFAVSWREADGRPFYRIELKGSDPFAHEISPEEYFKGSWRDCTPQEHSSGAWRAENPFLTRYDGLNSVDLDCIRGGWMSLAFVADGASGVVFAPTKAATVIDAYETFVPRLAPENVTAILRHRQPAQ
jgi:hypothetical protein